MRILAIDTSTSWCSVALSFDEQLIHRHELIGSGASQYLLPWINGLLQQANLKLSELDAIAVGVGPGAFTGVRLAVAVTQGLAIGANLPVIPVSSLDAMAMQVLHSEAFQTKAKSNAHYLVALDARMGEVYWACYQANTPIPKRLEHITVSSPQSINLAGIEYIAGNALQEYPEHLGSLLSEDCMDRQLVPNALGILQCAKPQYEAGKMIVVDQLEPVYIRNKVALTTQERSAATHSPSTGELLG